MNFHIHVYETIKLYELEINAKDEEEGKLIALSLIKKNEGKIKSKESDFKYIALGSKEAWGHIIGQ